MTKIGISQHEVMETTVSESRADLTSPFQMMSNAAWSEFMNISYKSLPTVTCRVSERLVHAVTRIHSDIKKSTPEQNLTIEVTMVILLRISTS